MKDESENINKGNWLAPLRENIHSTGGSQCQRKCTWHLLEINFVKDLAVFLEENAEMNLTKLNSARNFSQILKQKLISRSLPSLLCGIFSCMGTSEKCEIQDRGRT